MNPLLPRIILMHQAAAKTPAQAVLIQWAKGPGVLPAIKAQVEQGLENARGETVAERLRGFVRRGFNWGALPQQSSLSEQMQVALEDRLNHIPGSPVAFSPTLFQMDLKADHINLWVRLLGETVSLDTELPDRTFEDEIERVLRAFGAASPSVRWAFIPLGSWEEEKQVQYETRTSFLFTEDLLLAILPKEELEGLAQKVLDAEDE